MKCKFNIILWLLCQVACLTRQEQIYVKFIPVLMQKNNFITEAKKTTNTMTLTSRPTKKISQRANGFSKKRVCKIEYKISMTIWVQLSDLPFRDEALQARYRVLLCFAF